MTQFDTIQKFGRDGIEAVTKSFGAIARGAQSATAETTDYAKRSLETGTAAIEKLAGIRTLDKAIELQTELARTSYESFVAQATRMGELATATVKEAIAPIETLVSKAPQSA